MSTSNTKGTSLLPPSWSYYSSTANCTPTSPEVLAHHDLYAWIQDQLDNDKPVYVKFTHDARRAGSIGRIKNINIREIPAHKSGASYYNYYPNYVTYCVDKMEVIWDGRSNLCNPYYSEIEILRDYEGPTVWKWVQKAPETRVIPTIKGHLGEEIVVDDFVSFVSRKYGTVKLHFGNVSRINYNGSVWVNTLKLRDGDRPEEVKVHDPDTIVKIGKDLIDRLVMARLAAR